MSNRVVLAWNTTYEFPENLAVGDNIDLQTTGKLVNLAAATTAGDAMSYGQSGASLAGLALTGNLAMGGNSITSVATPVNTTDGVNKAYVDGLVNGVQWKPPVIAMSNANIATLSGLTTTVDSIALNSANMRVLLTAQTTGTQDGIWAVQSGAWTRPADYTTGSHAAGAATLIEEGSTYGDTAWTCVTLPGSDVVDTNSTVWSQFGSVAATTASHGLQKVTNDIQLNPGDGITLSSGNVYTQLNLTASNPGLQLVGSSPTKTLSALTDPNGGLQLVSAGIQVKIASANDLSASSSGLDVVGVPASFKVAGASTSANVTASNLNTLTAGLTSDATTLHTHTSNGFAAVTVGALASGDPVYWSSTSGQIDKALGNTDAKSFVVGLNNSTAVSASGTANVIHFGKNPGVLTGATPGNVYYLQPTGGFATTIPGSGGNSIVQVGFAMNATDLFVTIQRFGKRV